MNTTAYKDAREIAGNELTTFLSLEKASVADINNVTLEEGGGYVPKTNTTIVREDEKRRSLRNKEHRNLKENGDELNSASCMTVVKNSHGKLVGQLVGNCVKANFSQALAEASTLCLDVRNSIEIADVFDVAGFADYDPIGGGYTAREEVAVVTGGQYCVTVSETSFLCPIHRVEGYEEVTEDMGSDDCELVVNIVDRMKLTKPCETGVLCVGSPEFFIALGVVTIMAILGCVVLGFVKCCRRRKGESMKHEINLKGAAGENSML